MSNHNVTAKIMSHEPDFSKIMEERDPADEGLVATRSVLTCGPYMWYLNDNTTRFTDTGEDNLRLANRQINSK